MTVAAKSTSSYINIDCVEQCFSSRVAKTMPVRLGPRDLTNGIVTPKKSERVMNSEGQANTCLVILFSE
jgi:hypothetical protein